MEPMVDEGPRPAANRAGDGPDPAATGKALLSLGAVLGAVAASSCCLVPLGLFSLGLGGAWIGNLTAMAPYQPIVVAATVAFIGAGFYLAYGKPRAAAADPKTICAATRSDRLIRTALWGSSVLVVVAVVFNYTAPYFLGV